MYVVVGWEGREMVEERHSGNAKREDGEKWKKRFVMMMLADREVWLALSMPATLLLTSTPMHTQL